jgi:hypothetical protein
MPVTSSAGRPVLDDIPVRFWFSLYIVLGVFIAMAMLSVALRGVISIHIGPIFLTGNGLGDSELRDRILYLPFYMLAPVAVLLANWRTGTERLPAPGNWLVVLAVIGFVHLGLLAASTGLRWLFLVIAAAIAVTALRRGRGEYHPAAVVVATRPRLNWRDAIAIAAICILLLPVSNERLAAHIGASVAKISYFVGPALYGYGEHLTPGLDFYSHYGPGLGPVFFSLMGEGWKSAAMRGVGLTVVTTALFYCAEYLILLFLTGSRLLAFAASVFTALLNFSSYIFFDAPSAYPIRYAFLLPFVLAFGWLCGGSRRTAAALVMAVFAGLSLFWHTEIGLYLMLAGCGGVVLACGIRPSAFALILIFLAGSLAIFFAVAWTFWGGPALSGPFLLAALKPVVAYSAGWDGVPVKWNTFWSLFYNIPLQAVALVTVGGFWFLMWFRYDSLTARERQVGGVLAMLSLAGLGMLVKWVNRSLDAEWHQNAVPLILVICWWGHYLWINSRARAAFARAGRAARVSIASAPIAAALLFLLTVNDSANPYPYGLRSYVAYPSLAKAIVAPSRLYDPLSYGSDWASHGGGFDDISFGWDWPPLLTGISDDDIALIRRYAKPHERVMVVSSVDWAYLAEAHRPPKAIFVPVVWAFDPAFIERSLDNADIVFLDSRFGLEKGPVTDDLVDRIRKNYVPGEHSTTLTLYRLRKPPE